MNSIGYKVPELSCYWSTAPIPLDEKSVLRTKLRDATGKCNVGNFKSYIRKESNAVC